MTGRVEGEGMPEVIWLSGGIVVPTRLVAAATVGKPEGAEEVAEEVEEAAEEGDEAKGVEEEGACLFAMRAWRSLASTATRRAKRATRVSRCMMEKRTTKPHLYI